MSEFPTNISELLEGFPKAARHWALSNLENGQIQDVYLLAKAIERLLADHGEALSMLPVALLVTPENDRSKPKKSKQPVFPSRPELPQINDKIGHLSIQTFNKRVKLSLPDGEQVLLTPVESMCFIALLQSSATVDPQFGSQPTNLLEVFEYDDTTNNRTRIRVSVSKVREVLRAFVPGLEEAIISVRSEGYVFDREIAAQAVAACFSQA